MQLITVHMPLAYLKGIDELITMGVYPNRSEAIRMAVRDLLKTEFQIFNRQKNQEKEEIRVEF